LRVKTVLAGLFNFFGVTLVTDFVEVVVTLRVRLLRGVVVLFAVAAVGIM
jgi:hypothetical protein|tara:strand:+ start:2217 stop:2366 length:150 start_codon:yes stop_codon:yes gene_type:complete